MRTMGHEQRSAKSAQMAQERAQAKAPQSTTALSGTGWLPEGGFKGPIVTTHAVLMRTGKVLFIAGSTTDLRIFEQVPPVEDPEKANSCPSDPNDTNSFPPLGSSPILPRCGTLGKTRFLGRPFHLIIQGSLLTCSASAIPFCRMAGY